MNGNKNSLLAFGRVQPPATARTETNEMGAQDVRMPIYDFLEYEKALKLRCYRNMALTAAGATFLVASGLLYYLKKSDRLKKKSRSPGGFFG